MKVNVADLRKDYTKRKLDIHSVDKDPFLQFENWLEESIMAEVPEPTAMTLATASKDGRVTSRIVLLKGVEEKEFLFFTNYESRKGKNLLENPYASLTFFWPQLERQICITGTVNRTSTEKSDNYFHSRPRASQIGAWVSPQSNPITSRYTIVKSFIYYSAKFVGQEVPRPPHWGGYALSPNRIEFWQGRPSRLHDRIVFTNKGNNEWLIQRAAP